MISSLFSGLMKYGYVTMVITIFGFCLHAVMRQAFPSLQPSVAYPGHAPYHGHLDIQYTFKCAIYTQQKHDKGLGDFLKCCWSFWEYA